jgi:hypothetical protein
VEPPVDAAMTSRRTAGMMPAMTDDPTASRKLAVPIDADNASAQIAAGLFEEIAKIGEASVRRIYGNFTGTRLKGWVGIAPLYACLPHQNFANTVGKNTSDIALVIDAMDLLHSAGSTASASCRRMAISPVWQRVSGSRASMF